MLDSLHVCGSVLSTADFNYFALRCAECEAPFGQWTSFIKHLERQHGHDVLKGECNSEEEFSAEDLQQVIKDEQNAARPKSESETEAAEWQGDDESTDEAVKPGKELGDSGSVKMKNENYLEEKHKRKAPIKHSRRHKKRSLFSFNLQDAEFQEISIEFLKVLESKRVLWDSRHKDYREPEARTKALEATKAHFEQLGYTITDVTMQLTIPKIMRSYKQAQQELAMKGKVDSGTQLLLNKCKFLSESAGTAEKATMSDTDEDMGDAFNEEEANDNTEDTGDSDAVDTGTEFYKAGGRYKRIRFHIHPNPIVTELIQLLHANPLLWDTTRSDYNNILERKRILSSWIPRFEQQHNVTFTYEEISMNLQVLRRLYNTMGERKSLDEAALYVKQHCSFMPETKPVVRIKCEHCDRSFLMQINYQAHLYNVHSIGENPFKCEHCGKCFPSYSQLDAHLKAVHIKSYSFFCEVCNRGFLRKNDLTFHMHTHTGEKTFICETCGKGFRRRLNLKNHETRIHLRLRNFACELCPKAFYTKALLRDHMNAHLGIRRYMCPHCDKGFHSSHALMRHKQIHAEVKRYACKLCDARFHQFVGLNSHMKNRHKFVQTKDEEQEGDATVAHTAEDSISAAPMRVQIKGELLHTADGFALV